MRNRVKQKVFLIFGFLALLSSCYSSSKIEDIKINQRVNGNQCTVYCGFALEGNYPDPSLNNVERTSWVNMDLHFINKGSSAIKLAHRNTWTIYFNDDTKNSSSEYSDDYNDIIIQGYESHQAGLNFSYWGHVTSADDYIIKSVTVKIPGEINVRISQFEN
jgi:hypothetical protein